MPDRCSLGQRFPYAAAFGVYTVAFLALASPWLLGLRPHPLRLGFAVLSAVRVPGALARRRPVAVLDAQRFRRLAADCRSAIADLLPLYLIVALLEPDPSPRLFDVLMFGLLYAGGAGVMLLFRDRGWHVGGGGGGGARLQPRRLGRLAHPAHRSGRKPGVPAAGALDAGARARALVVARGRGARACSRRSS